uniref:BAG domain-containing protein n=1 Tax=Caenorhabditis tropicalis TaxID=1561998 RepID=A0A1I7T4G5_9PELO
MVNSPTSSSDDSFSSLNSGSTLESFSVSPQIVIRRPIDVPVTPAPVPLVSDAIPYPRIDNTSTAIELESTDAFQNIITEFFKEMESNQKLEVEIIPSPSSNCAKVREMNRLEAVQLGILGLSSDNEDEILEATGLVEWNLRRIDSEIETIDRFILDFEDEKQRKIKKWENIEQILKQMRDIS